MNLPRAERVARWKVRIAEYREREKIARSFGDLNGAKWARVLRARAVERIRAIKAGP